jgi:hypothetical protein
VRFYKGLADKSKFTRIFECAENSSLETHEGVGTWIVDSLKSKRMLGRDVCKEVDLHNDKLAMQKQRRVDDQCDEISKDLLLPLRNMDDCGRYSDTHYGYRVTGDVKCT